jgi:type II secretory pathway component PulJ
VLGALALLALLLLGVYSGIRTATQSVQAGGAAIERLDRIRSAQEFLRRELAQAMAQPIGRDDRGDALYFKGTPHELSFVAPLPGYLGKLGPQVQTLALVDNGRSTASRRSRKDGRRCCSTTCARVPSATAASTRRAVPATGRAAGRTAACCPRWCASS